jgi:hypothetical protein
MKTQRFVLLAVALSASLPAVAGITYTCDASINSTLAGLCGALNSTVAGFYNSTFTNANATIYIQVANNGGLGESSVGYLNLQTYNAYQGKLSTESTDAARNTLPAGTEPAIFGGGSIELTSALKDAMGIGGTTVGTEFKSTANGGTAANGWIGSSCTNPGDGAVVVASPTACYNGVITIDTEAELLALEGNQGYFFPGLAGGGGTSTFNYDFYSIVQHETDEVLGTTSCTDRSASGLSDGCGGANNASVNDLFRYSGAGTRVFNSTGGSQYFSANGGVTDYEGNQFPSALGSGDWADFSSSCTFVQDSSGCPTNTSTNTQFNITTDGPGGIAGPEIAMLNAVGYNLNTSAPEPATFGLIGMSLAVAGFVLRRRKS